MDSLPNLATDAPLWLTLLTVGVNAVVGALRGYPDPARHWYIVGVSMFALLMGLGGGFIRDVLIGNLPAESLRSLWFVVTVLAAICLVVVIGPHLVHVAPLMTLLNALALGLLMNVLSGARNDLRKPDFSWNLSPIVLPAWTRTSSSARSPAAADHGRQECEKVKPRSWTSRSNSRTVQQLAVVLGARAPHTCVQMPREDPHHPGRGSLAPVGPGILAVH